MSFALVDTKTATVGPVIELVLSSGDRLRIPRDPAILRMVLSVFARGVVIHLPASVRVHLCATPCDLRSIRFESTCPRNRGDPSRVWRVQLERSTASKRSGRLRERP